jgi:LmbE family N-acetylglucosaminyl deacetylase
MSATLSGRVVALSPHLDDAVLSVGAALWGAARSGARVTVVTAFAGDPASTLSAGPWDARCGFENAGEAARARRGEDRSACARIGAEPVWLPFQDEQYTGGGDEDEVWEALAPLLAEADVVLAPGFPLDHHDHRRLTELVRARLSGPALGLYAEQPYAMIERSNRPVPVAGRVPYGARAALAKLRASLAYRSQLLGFARPALRVPLLILRHERGVGGETIGWSDRG